MPFLQNELCLYTVPTEISGFWIGSKHMPLIWHDSGKPSKWTVFPFICNILLPAHSCTWVGILCQTKGTLITVVSDGGQNQISRQSYSPRASADCSLPRKALLATSWAQIMELFSFVSHSPRWISLPRTRPLALSAYANLESTSFCRQESHNLAVSVWRIVFFVLNLMHAGFTPCHPVL